MGKRPRNRPNNANSGRPSQPPAPKPAAAPSPKPPAAGTGPAGTQAAAIVAPASAPAPASPSSSTRTVPPPKKPTPARSSALGAGRGVSGRLAAIGAIFSRNFFAYFSNPAGYVFITLFVLICAATEFLQPAFFANNLANLGPLNAWMPYLLVIFIPAITMNAWAEERRLGTDELLLTLPARDVEVVLGKYLAALGIYTVALAFSLSLVAILAWLGSPDLGVVASTYLGYWLMGAMMIALGLVASVLSSNVTVAFILGAVFAAVPVFADWFGYPFGLTLRRAIEDLSIPNQFAPTGTGVVPLVSVFYFVTLAVAMLYLNMVLLGRRHWAGGERSAGLGLQAFVRVLSVVIALGAADVLIARYANLRFDLSSEGLHRLSPESLRLIREIPADRPVYVEAYYSEEVPRDYVTTKLDVLNKLREFAAASGGRIRLNLVPTDLYSEEARQAEKRFGITPKRVIELEEARQVAPEVFLGVAFTSGAEEVVLPFFDKGLPVEYELTRSIRVVSKSARKRLGVLQTDAKLLGGFDFRSMGQSTEWPIVSELKKQYDVISTTADSPIDPNLDVLLVAQPSSLTQPQIDNLVAHVKAGKPTLLFVDPLPRVDPQIAPEVPRQSPGGPMGGGPPPEPKGDLGPLLDLLGIAWPSSQIVWDPYNPHPQLGEVPPEIVFVSKGGGGAKAFNAADPATSGLQEIVMLWAGSLRPKSGGGEFTPLLGSSDQGGTIPFSELMQMTMFGASENPNRRYVPSDTPYNLAARITGKPPGSDKPLSAIVVADLDMISELVFNIRRQKLDFLNFDNIAFVLNCVDELAGDTSFLDLRKKRIAHRTLTRIEDESRGYVEKAQAETKDAEDAATAQLAAAQKRLDAKVDLIKKEPEGDAQTKRVRLERLEEVENLRLAVERRKIEDDKRKRLSESKIEVELAIRRIRSGVHAVALLVPPLPALLLGALVFAVRLGRENRGANPNRIA